MQCSNIRRTSTQTKIQSSRSRWRAFVEKMLEGVSLNNSPSDPELLMNSRAEFHQGQVARVEVVRGLED